MPCHRINVDEAGEAPMAQAWQASSFDTEWAWFRLLARTALPPESAPALWYADADGQLLAGLPVRRDGPRRLAALGNFYTASFAPQLRSVAAMSALLREMMAAERAYSLDLQPMAPEDSRFEAMRTALAGAGLVCFDYFCFGNWYLPARGLRYDDYLAGRPGSLRSTLKRKGKKFAAAGGRIEIVSGGAELDGAMAAYQQVYDASWKRTEPFPDFMPGFMRLCAERGWLRLGVARLGEVPIAAQVWVVRDGHAAIYKLAYDDAQGEWSAGSLLTAALMRRMLDEEQVDEVDYLIGDDAYKRDWMTHRRERRGLRAYDPRRWRGAMATLGEMLRRAARPLVARWQR
ncbi:GNAT family N-acetyltransferase [Denitromonas iodatirespirans]|uniref:GNAT family N-acetyltransferase n=1 Tax=Denitromonas iodatirespirans TaxID=2795389 RepID=A0A944D912_DENI1|nr:GNAT family N-acetyltransferase [Denitromonas iodatirespirans]MBT0960591.1 GNAT family N-acetyltransferase [Denitromonas iodatirespirans]